jgi:hypothetical protein
MVNPKLSQRTLLDFGVFYFEFKHFLIYIIYLPLISSVYKWETESRGSSVGVGTGWMAGVQFPVGSSLLHSVQTNSGPTYPPIHWVPWGSFPGGKVTGACS